MESRLIRASIILAAIGVAVSVYMTVYKVTDNQTMCLGNGGCSVVNQSVFSEVYGIPVAGVGVLGYAAILLVLMLGRRVPVLGYNSSLVVFGLCLAGFLFTAYLVYVEVAILKALCPFCVTSQVVMTLLFALALIRIIREPVD